MDPQINLTLIRYQTKARWLAEQRRKVHFLDRVERSVPWWLVVIAMTLFALSAPHTAATFSRITPVLGVAAPLLVEFGLLYAAFRRKQCTQRHEPVPGIVWGLEILLFITAIIVNGAGAFTAVVTSVGVADLSFSQMLNTFTTLPAPSQVALILVPIAALIIPIGTAVAGEGLAALILERRQVQDTTETQWAEVAPRLLYVAFFDALIAQGVTPGKAKQLAAQYADSDVRTERTKDTTDRSGHEKPAVDMNGQSEDTAPPPSGQPLGTEDRRLRRPNAYTDALRLLSENPDWRGVPLRVLEARTDISKSVWEKAKKANETPHSNGHNREE